MLSYSHTQKTMSFIWWDTVGAGANPVAPYQIVSLADSTEVAAAVTAGYADARVGNTVIVAPTGTVLGQTINNRRIIGVTKNAAKNGDEVLVVVEGIAEVMMNAAVAADALLFGVARATRTTAQTPLTSLPELLLPVDPSFTLTYQFMLADDPTLTYSSGGANVIHYPLGYAMQAATAQYDVIPVHLKTQGVVG